MALLFTTDPALDDAEIVELVDDRGLQPAENVTPLARREVVAAFGSDLTARIDAVSRLLTTAVLRDLNQQVAENGNDVVGAARTWLEQQGFV